MFQPLPSFASFLHAGVRDGYEVVFFRGPAAPDGTGLGVLLEGGTAAVEGHVPWSVNYRVQVNDTWRTSRVSAVGLSSTGRHQLAAEVRDGRWWIDGVERPDLGGCVDIDFESSLVTNTLAVHRIDLTSTAPIEVPAAFVRADDLRVERMEQTYRCVEHSQHRMLFDYTSTTFDFACRLTFDTAGLVVDYPGIGRRHQ